MTGCRWWGPALLLLAACAPGGGPGGGPSREGGAEAVVAQRWTEYAADLASSDPAAVTANFALDGQLTEANREVMAGHPDIERNFRMVFGVMHLPETVFTSEFSALEGDRIYDFGHLDEVIQLPGEQSWPQRGRYAAIWRREADGWLIERLVLVPVPPAEQ